MAEFETRFDPTDEECPQCGALLDHARYVRLVRSMAVGAPPDPVEDETLGEWDECLDCGHLSKDLADLPEGARTAWLETWG